MKTANELASAILGHQDGCKYATGECLAFSWEIKCTCSHPPEVQVAAIRGTLRREHQGLGGDVCVQCGADRPSYEETEDGRGLRWLGRGLCAPPIDDGEKWRMLRELVRRDQAIVGPDDLSDDAIVRCYIAAHDSGLLDGDCESWAADAPGLKRGPDVELSGRYVVNPETTPEDVSPEDRADPVERE